MTGRIELYSMLQYIVLTEFSWFNKKSRDRQEVHYSRWVIECPKLKYIKMKSFVVIFDGFNLSKSALTYSIELTKAAKAHLTAVFLDEFTYHSYDIAKVIRDYDNYQTKIKELDIADNARRNEAAEQFQKACNKAGITFSIRHDKGFSYTDLKEESLFADLIIISELETFSKYKTKSPTLFIKDLLAGIHCPVLVVPDTFKPVEKIILLYDGSLSSMHAIKMFSYLFDNFFNKPIHVLTVKENYMSNRLPHNKLMRIFIRQHFTKPNFSILKGEAKEQIIGYLRSTKENKLVVLGAYHRSEVSRWLKMSMADVLMKEMDIPLFIAHSK